MERIPERPLTVELVRDRHERLRSRLRASAERSGHDPARLRIVGVTKTWPVEVCRTALEAGIEMLGENRVQEAESKVPALPEADWHLVGTLQSNKARRAVRLFATIHSVDSIPLLRRLDAIAGEEGRRTAVLLQVNLTGAPGRGGFEEAWFTSQASSRTELAEAIGELRSIVPVGLMTMGSPGAPDREARAVFRRLRQLREALEQAARTALPELSMGMTGDAEAAAAEGATLVRIGTALFGPRHHH